MSRTINEYFPYVKIKLYNRKINKVKKNNNKQRYPISIRFRFSIIAIIDALISFFFFNIIYQFLKISISINNNSNNNRHDFRTTLFVRLFKKNLLDETKVTFSSQFRDKEIRVHSSPRNKILIRSTRCYVVVVVKKKKRKIYDRIERAIYAMSNESIEKLVGWITIFRYYTVFTVRNTILMNLTMFHRLDDLKSRLYLLHLIIG